MRDLKRPHSPFSILFVETPEASARSLCFAKPDDTFRLRPMRKLRSFSLLPDLVLREAPSFPPGGDVNK